MQIDQVQELQVQEVQLIEVQVQEEETINRHGIKKPQKK